MRITRATPVSGFRVSLEFNDGVTGTVDLSSFAGRGVFKAWEQPGVFEQATITPEGALAWPGEIDLCPDMLYLQVTGKQPEELFPAVQHPPAPA